MGTTPNPLRGETTVELDGKTIKLKSTWEALVAIEQRCKCGLLTLAQRCKEMDIRITDIAVMIDEFSQAAGTTIPYANIGRALFKEGFLTKMGPVFSLLMDACTAGSKEIVDPPKAVEEEKRDP